LHSYQFAVKCRPMSLRLRLKPQNVSLFTIKLGFIAFHLEVVIHFFFEYYVAFSHFDVKFIMQIISDIDQPPSIWSFFASKPSRSCVKGRHTTDRKTNRRRECNPKGSPG